MKKKKPSGCKKKPAGKPVLVEEVKEATKGEEGGKSCKLDKDEEIDQGSLVVGGGRNQSYIQHRPLGPKTPLRLVVACTKQQAAKMKKSHRELVELLLPACKRPG